MGISLGQSNGKLVSTGGAIQSVAKPIDNMALSFNYTGGQWVFSLTNMTRDFQAIISEGYTVQLQVIRYIGGKSKSNFRLKNGDTITKRTRNKKHNGIKSDVTLAVSSTPTNIILTSFVNQIITDDQSRVYSKNYIAADNSYFALGKWFRRYRFCLIVNNISYAETSDLYIWTHNQGPISQVNQNYTYSNGSVDIYPL
jgi:hypothetical protein